MPRKKAKAKKAVRKAAKKRGRSVPASAEGQVPSQGEKGSPERYGLSPYQ